LSSSADGFSGFFHFLLEGSGWGCQSPYAFAGVSGPNAPRRAGLAKTSPVKNGDPDVSSRLAVTVHWRDLLSSGCCPARTRISVRFAAALADGDNRRSAVIAGT